MLCLLVHFSVCNYWRGLRDGRFLSAHLPYVCCLVLFGLITSFSTANKPLVSFSHSQLISFRARMPVKMAPTRHSSDFVALDLCRIFSFLILRLGPADITLHRPRPSKAPTLDRETIRRRLRSPSEFPTPLPRSPDESRKGIAKKTRLGLIVFSECPCKG